MLSTNLKRAALALILSAVGGFTAHAQDEAGNEVTLQVEAQADGGITGTARTVPGLNIIQWSSNFQEPAPYWIGVEGQPLDTAMRIALELPEKHGILIARVTAESPAAKAGLQAGDILMQWCDADKNCQPIESVEHLVRLVQETAAKQPEQAVKLEYRRRGKTDTVEVIPAKRAEMTQAFTLNLKADKTDPHEHARHQQSAMQQQLKTLERQRAAAKEKFEQAKQAVEGKAGKAAQANLAQAEMQLKMLDAQTKQAEAQLKQFETWTKAMSAHGFSIGNPNGANFDVLIPAPGLVTNPYTNPYNPQHPLTQFKQVEWPEDLSVTMTRTGNKPAEFTIQRGETKWQVTSDKLSELPPEIRTVVEPLANPQKSRMMRLFQTQGNEGPGRVELRLPEEARPAQPVMPIAPPRVVIHATPQLQPAPVVQASQKQIEDLQKAIEQLRKQVEQMERK